ncbi:MAG: hypothetical protein A2365_02450 [Candidatus Nealsonbacteria bacterium RIFOXYB1_FULL_40_15]|uniref:Tyrosine recombinase XerC n=2 Tax=Candidatus Nealsoniibacteriota TaxID=1817911 RepID=A0A1G2EPF2_9BACT|nr:MAG: hypothetical protein A2365_02450 [Candidatus Nealsonbacteria bacterium RIFOXYB1_FULL_40_15]OGZ27649.1 MAG: hypothetical protein A2427_02775 [Candidatus Nealsonbacteria bacterium RIFOXYC1_FULL_40_7]OGZ28693.1 MAG: hypothetical protein A2562_00580 [Candidatus Nealsonbacteria bacterium RIFOXYD1_FULL_39_11]
MKESDKPIISYIPRFFEYLDIEKGLSGASQETYSRLIHKFLGWLKENNLESLKPHELTQKHLWDYRVYLSRRINPHKRTPLARSTQNHYLIVLRNLLKFFTDIDVLSLPAEKIKLPKNKSDQRIIKFLALDQIKKLLEAPDTSNVLGLRDKAILEVFFSTGLRIAELISLDKEQIKIKPGSVGLEIVMIGKGNRPRPVYFSSRALKWLKQYLDTRKDKEKALFISYNGPKRASARLSSRSIENIVKKYATAAGAPNFTTPHTLRHSFATDLLEKGVDLREIQEFLGHKNIGTTQIYAHVTSKKLRDIHKKFHSLEE